jgi:ribosomal protein L11 methyltransferase
VSDPGLRWTAADIAVPAEADETALEILSAALFEVGAAGLETKDQVEPTLLIASFPPEIGPEELPARIEAALEAAGVEPVSVALRTIEPIDWANHWRQHFQPMSFGRLWVVPTWLEAPEGAEHVLRLDPGMAFGIGSHATTALCLERIVELSPIESVLDVGTGTGILAMAALRCGGSVAVGTDNDPDALMIARENAELNDLAERFELTAAEPDALGRRFKVVVANILADPLVHLAPRIARAIEPKGTLILSGLLTEQIDRVAPAYEALGFGDRKVATRGEWARIELTAKGA